MGTSGIYLLLAFLQLTLAHNRPGISYVTPDQIKDIGGTVDLQCMVQNAQEFPVLWVKGTENPLPISSGATTIVRDNRFSLRYDTASSTYTLQIKDIQETDAASYQCLILISLNNRISAEVELKVRRQPVISDNSTRSLVTGEGQSVQLQCYASGYPSPRISWRRENNEILATGGSIYRGNTLEISSIRKEDRGNYFCVAENGVGKAVRRKIPVKVEFAPVITALRQRVGQALHYGADLECLVEAYPPPQIFWLRDEAQLISNQNYMISQFSSEDEFTDTNIRVLNIDKSRYGIYICRAVNKLGTAEIPIELFETMDPICPPACGIARNVTTEMPLLSSSEPPSSSEQPFSTEPPCTSTPSPPLPTASE